MNIKTIIKKKRILSRISRRQYRELLSFVEDIYLADYSLKVLIARKGSNLYSALIDLVREEDGGRVQQLYEKKFAGKEKPVIVSDRGLDYYAEGIKRGRYPTILICDDTVRHGKTMIELYDKISELLPEGENGSKLDVRAFAACREDVERSAHIRVEDIKKIVNFGEYRAVSDLVIDILYLAGQPYTSYIPNIVLQKESSLYPMIIERMATLPTGFPDGEEQKRLQCRAAVWIAQKTPGFAMFESMRFYRNDDLEQCTLVPMVSLMPIPDKSLLAYGKVLKNLISEKYYDKVFFECRELSYRTVIYVVSALFLRQYIREELGWEAQIDDLENPKEEQLNFGEQILNQQILNQMSIQEIEDILKKLEAAYEVIDPEQIRQLDADTEKLSDRVTEQISRMPSQKIAMDDLARQFFSVSGEWNEKKWADISCENIEQKCPSDFPFVCLADQLHIDSGDRGRFYTQVLKEADYGSGSIVDRKKEKDGKIYYLSFLNAGERNYKYKMNKYFPFLYGLLEIERKAKEEKKNPDSYKILFFKKFPQNDGYETEELEEFCNMDITARYMPVLLKDVWSYPNKTELEQSIILADEIMQSKDTD